ncbi:cytochrome o ubiquinol oxidase subunit I [Acidihalobacter yilgarnensis]|uniref:Cytochrome o ubiquinol oxidase subunit I n=1 Tax=Acidihalobacter yilgarnensis TaxID=2819280 RepID=A0A1D8IN82_9GAMM|nr:cbb3-type cytochrome c oxidase subunit I [Acidihalobacter yilgarnensis]AOU97926.1 cytochrome o ubiquinol oxidase subunit I [Acidihalobacter yilgarnensis]
MLVDLQGPWNPIFGRLGLLLEVHYNNPVLFFAFELSVVVGVILLFWATCARKWGYIWREWLTTVDHKKIGVMYIVVGLVMMFRGFFDALMIRSQQAIAVGPDSPGVLGAAHGYLPPYHFDQVFTAHGMIMILVAATPILVGMMNIIVPLQIGARDMAYPYLNALGLWFTVVSAALVMIALFIGDFSHAGWVGLAPLTELPYSPGVGVDYWIWSIQIGSIGTTMGAINLIATIIKMRAPGMTWGRLPVFTWTSMASNIIALTSFPVLGVTLALLTFDRYLGTHFFTVGLGGDLMMYTNLFWIWGHPEVYFVVLPAFGMLSEIIPTFSEKPLFGYITMVIASMAIAAVSWSVWLHHFFTMGAGPNVNAFFSLATMLVGIPTGVKVFNWAFTMYRSRIRFDTPMLWAVGSMFLLISGGLTGMMLAVPAINYIVHNSVFVIAHFHNMFLLIVYAAFGAVSYWFPKVFGFKLDERLGKRFFWFFTAGTLMVFIPMYTLGFMGMTRRLDYITHPAWQPLLIAEMVGIGLYAISIVYFVLQLVVSIRDREKNAVGADAWGTSRNLEWATHSPVPFYNFAVTPIVHDRDEWAWRRQHGLTSLRPDHYVDIHMPKNTAVPLILGMLSLAFGFAMVWRIWWLAAVSAIAMLIVILYRSFDKDTDYIIPAADVERMENEMLARGNKVEQAGGAVGSGAYAAPQASAKKHQGD